MSSRVRGALALLLGGALAAACNEPARSPMGPEPGTAVALELSGLAALDTALVGPYQVWFTGGDGGLHAGARFAAPTDGAFTLDARSPIEDPAQVMVTWEPASDGDPAPSQLKLMGGRFESGTAVLGLNGYVTPNIPLEAAPGVHVLRTYAAFGPPGLPLDQDAGLWVMNPAKDTLSGDFYQDFSPVTEGWMYEGWVVRDLGSGGEVWFSYGKFRPDGFRQARFRDETGLGPFSGKADYERALPFDVRVPGDDWLANPMGVPVPGGLSLPLDLNGDGAAGIPSRWTHVITLEPYEERWEDPWTSQPTFLRPYRNAIGEGPPDSLRVILYDPSGIPRGTATLSGS